MSRAKKHRYHVRIISDSSADPIAESLQTDSSKYLLMNRSTLDPHRSLITFMPVAREKSRDDYRGLALRFDRIALIALDLRVVSSNEPFAVLSIDPDTFSQPARGYKFDGRDVTPNKTILPSIVGRQCRTFARTARRYGRGPRTARLTEFASVLEVPLISRPMSRLHARNPRSPPTAHNLQQPLRPPALTALTPRRLRAFRRLRRVACVSAFYIDHRPFSGKELPKPQWTSGR